MMSNQTEVVFNITTNEFSYEEVAGNGLFAGNVTLVIRKIEVTNT
jgi:hypothetical protein